MLISRLLVKQATNCKDPRFESDRSLEGAKLFAPVSLLHSSSRVSTMDDAIAGRFSFSSAESSSRLKRHLKWHDELFSAHVLQLRFLFRSGSDC